MLVNWLKEESTFRQMHIVWFHSNWRTQKFKLGSSYARMAPDPRKLWHLWPRGKRWEPSSNTVLTEQPYLELLFHTCFLPSSFSFQKMGGLDYHQAENINLWTIYFSIRLKFLRLRDGKYHAFVCTHAQGSWLRLLFSLSKSNWTLLIKGGRKRGRKEWREKTNINNEWKIEIVNLRSLHYFSPYEVPITIIIYTVKSQDWNII